MHKIGFIWPLVGRLAKNRNKSNEPSKCLAAMPPLCPAPGVLVEMRMVVCYRIVQELSTNLSKFVQNCSKSGLCGPLGGSVALLAPSWPFLAPSWPIVTTRPSKMGAMLDHLGPMLAHLGAMLAHLGTMLAHLGAMLAPCWPILHLCWSILRLSLPILAPSLPQDLQHGVRVTPG